MPKYHVLSKNELAKELRRIRGASSPLMSDAKQEDPQLLLHELQVHRIEVEMQNRQLSETQELLEESRSRYADLYDFAPVGYCTLNEKGCIQEINLTGASLLGVERGHLIGKPFTTVVSMPNITPFWDHLKRCSAEQARVATDLNFSVRNRGPVTVQLVSTPFFKDGKLVGYRTVLTDESQQVRASEQRLHLLMESVKDYAIVMLDLDGKVASWNAGAERIKGYSADEIIGQNHSRFYLEEDVRAGKPELELRAAAADGRYETERWTVRKDGSRFWGDVIVTPVTDATGVLRGFGKVTRDLTERKRAEEQRFNLIRAQDAVRHRDEFLSIASHELRTPLTTVQLQLESVTNALSGDAKGVKLNQKVQKALRQTRRLADLVERLLDLSRIEAKRLSLSREEVDLCEIMQEVIEDFRAQAENAGGRLILHPSAPIRGSWDRFRVEQILTNLLSNAIKYGAGQPIEVTMSVEGKSARLAIRDKGIGISPDEIERIFLRFERGVSLRQYGGLGLGLYISRNLAEAHGGCIRVTSTPNVGSTFTLELPLSPPQDSRTSSNEVTTGDPSARAG